VVGDLVPAERLTVVRRAYMRYAGQGYEIAVPLEEDLAGLDASTLRSAFETNYRRLYGRIIPDLSVEILSWTLNLVEAEMGDRLVPEADLRERLVQPEATVRLFDPVLAEAVEAASVERADLEPGDYLQGPALIREAQTTVVVSGGFDACVGERGSLLLTRSGGTG
jgi:N-methylhydantoinase A